MRCQCKYFNLSSQISSIMQMVCQPVVMAGARMRLKGFRGDYKIKMLETSLQAETKLILNSSQFKVARRLGKGGFGHVLLASKGSSSGALFAVKCIWKRQMSQDPQLKRFLLQEINTMAMLDHPNIVKLLKTFEEGDWCFLVMEYCELGNLHACQSRQPGRVFALPEAISICLQVLQGLDYVHQNGIIHRDIKLENIFLRKDSRGGQLCKIGDFGLARPIGDQESAITNCGTEIYMAPQILSGQCYGKQADVWSLGVLFYYLLFGDFPFKGMNILDEIKKRCKNGYKLFEHLHQRPFAPRQEQLLTQLFERLFELDPTRRITIRQWRVNELFRREGEMGQSAQQQQEEVVEWQLARVRFIQRIVDTVEAHRFLSPFLAVAFRFYINKVLLYFLTRQALQSYKISDAHRPQLVAELIGMEHRVRQELLAQLLLLTQGQLAIQVIDRFQDGLNAQAQQFATFKVGYRNTVGRVYQQAHRHLGDRLQERTILKLKLFLCHIINRVFTGSVNSAVFPHYASWLKRNALRVSERFYDFDSLEEWMRQEKPDNLQRSQDTINQMFYK